MRYRISHTTKYAYSEAVPVCQNKLHLRPRNLTNQTCDRFRLIVMPEPAVIKSQSDYFGNTVEYFSLLDSHRGLSITATSEVEVQSTGRELESASSPAWEHVAQDLKSVPPQAGIDECLFSFDSEYAAAAPALAEYAGPSFPEGRPIVEAALHLTHRIFEDFEYKPRVTNISTPLDEVLSNRAGVCQDFAHLQIACIRSMGLAARYVSGYLRTVSPEGKPQLVGADQSHAWLAVYCGEHGWIDFDPTNDVIPTTDHITIAYGRDYGDVSPIQGVLVGGGERSMTVSVDVTPIQPAETS